MPLHATCSPYLPAVLPCSDCRMPGKVIPCALCQAEAAAVFCVNDDAHLCTSCDASVHASNPLLARHERRPLTALASAPGECASAAHGSPTSTDCADVAVVPQLGGASPTVAVPEPQPAPKPAAPAIMPHWAEAATPVPQQLAEPSPAPLSLYEDSFFARSLTTSDLLDLDADDLELPGSMGGSGFACFDPLDDCVVPSFGGASDRFVPAAPSPYAQQVSQPGWSGAVVCRPSVLLLCRLLATNEEGKRGCARRRRECA